MKLTKSLKPSEVKRQWIIVDAANLPLGRLSTNIAARLSGKYQAKFTPHVDSGDFVIVINSNKVKLTGRKEQQKTYYKYSGYPGGLSESKASELRNNDSAEMITKSVYGMLPKNKLRPEMMKRLKVYTDEQHKHQAQSPIKLEVRL